MGLPLSGTLKALQRIYQFPGVQVAPPAVDISQDITVVHDVSREAEIGSGFGRFGGYASRQTSFTTAAGANNNHAVQAPFTLFLPGGLVPLTNRRPEDVWFWVMSTQVMASAPNSVSGLWVAAFVNANTPEFTADQFYLLRAGGNTNQVTNPPVVAGGTVPVVDGSTTAGQMQGSPIPNAMPFPLPTPGSEIRIGFRSQAAITATWNVLYWGGPRGILPPGMS